MPDSEPPARNPPGDRNPGDRNPGETGSQPPPRASWPPPAGEPHRTEGRDETDKKRRFAERVVPVIVKRLVERAVESGVEKLAEQPENLRNFISDLKLPKEVISDVYGQIDDTKNGLYRVVAKEIRDVLEQTQIADEIVKVLTKLSFEIKTEIRFVPNDAAPSDPEGDAPGRGGSNVKPKVTSEVTMRDKSSTDRDERARR